MREELDTICREFGITIDEVDSRLDGLGKAGLFIASRKVFRLFPRIYKRQIPGLHL